MLSPNYLNNTDRGLSKTIWGRCPIAEINEDPSKGFFFFDDFRNFSKHISAQNVQQYASYIDTGVTIQQAADDMNGVLEVAGNDADNDEGSITTGGNTGGMCAINNNGTTGALFFEARIKKASVANDAIAVFVELSEEGLAAANTLIDDTGELASKDFVGFRVKQDAGAELDFVWRKAGGAVQEIAAITTLTADTWVKLGFYFDPAADIASRIRIYVDGVEYSTKVTAANIAAATFPAGEELALLLATKVGTAAEAKVRMDWWALAQLAAA